MKKPLFLLILLALPFYLLSQASLKGSIRCAESGEPLAMATIRLSDANTFSDEAGNFQFSVIAPGEHLLIIHYAGYKIQQSNIQVKDGEQLVLDIQLLPLLLDLEAVEVAAESNGGHSLRHLRNVEGMAIYAGKKTEVVELSRLTANLAVNNPRQIYQGIAGLNIWENDGSGLQLNIGARGLNPNRTSNFNTRQNGYDISADALGYPESYYTPPSQALERIEVVRGAASLQYGPQFGGLLNFVFKKGPKDKKLEWQSQNTIGSFGLKTTFNSLGGSIGKWNYYVFHQYKAGDGWRPNASFRQQTAYAAISHQWTEKFSWKAEYTFMDYLAQQPGGLQDFEFQQDPRQSKRARNWFQVNWNLAALKFQYQINDKTRLDNRFFYLNASRDALGELGAINRPDPLRERDLIMGKYQNFGNETRLIHRYEIGEELTTFLIGVRYYQGYTTNRQGDANDGADPDFQFLNPEDLERSDFAFPSKNVSVFAENLFNFGTWSFTPGLRFEHIFTSSEGYFKERVFSGGEVLFEQKINDQRANSRSFLLAGLGISKRWQNNLELYANFSQNYRSINFSDLAVANPNLVVDSLLSDERGHNIDLGWRGDFAVGKIRFDVSGFLLNYQNRIGLADITISDPIVIEKVVAYRTNIGSARIAGLESFIEADVLGFFLPDDHPLQLRANLNASILRGRYYEGRPDIEGNEVELIPPFSLKAGINISYGSLQLSYLFSHVGTHFSDATNAEQVVDATRGIIPAYQVQDLSLSYEWKWLQLQTGINNLANTAYFTRRATAYPGPGIIPADGRSFYLTLGLRF